VSTGGPEIAGILSDTGGGGGGGERGAAISGSGSAGGGGGAAGPAITVIFTVPVPAPLQEACEVGGAGEGIAAAGSAFPAAGLNGSTPERSFVERGAMSAPAAGAGRNGRPSKRGPSCCASCRGVETGSDDGGLVSSGPVTRSSSLEGACVALLPEAAAVIIPGRSVSGMGVGRSS
jgi:hypothetical protein